MLEQGTTDLLKQTGVGDRMMRDGFVHHGINLAFSGSASPAPPWKTSPVTGP